MARNDTKIDGQNPPHFNRLVGCSIIAGTMAKERKSIGQVFEELKNRGQFGFMPFVPAGFPDLETTARVIVELEKSGASVIEIGLPFSDPIADGPVIQEAFAAALSNGLKMKDVLETVKKVRGQVSIPLIAM